MKKESVLNRPYLTITILVYIIALLIYGYWDYSYRQNEIMKNIDTELYKSAAALKYILPDDFHDKAIDEQAISINEDQYLAHKLTKFIKATGFKYAYTIIKQGGKLYFVASDVLANPETKRGTFYFYPYEKADTSFINAFDKEGPTYKTVSDQWGTVRTVMIPEKSPRGIKYLACVDYDIGYINGILQKNLLRSIITVFFFLSLSIPIIILYTKQQSEHLASLRKSEERYRTLTELLPIGIFEVDNEGNVIFANDAAFQLTAYDKKDMETGLKISNVIASQDRDRLSKLYQQVLQGVYSDGAEYLIQRKDGSTYPGFINARPNRDDLFPGIIGYIFDLTKLKKAEKELMESEQKFRALVEQSPLGISLIAEDGRYKYINPRFQEIFGYTLDDCPSGKAWFDLAYPDEAYRQKVLKSWLKGLNQIETGQVRPNIYTVTCKDGSRKEIHFRPVTMENRNQFVIYEDVTERSRMEQQFQQAQKFEAIGTLAGGIAHDFNNLLMGIQGRASLMSTDLEPSNPHQEHTRAIEEYIRSATDLTKQLLGLARGGKYEVKPIDTNELVRHSSDMFGRTKKEIRIHTSFQDPPPVVAVDRNQIEQVLLNLYINAWQAMPGGGDLYLETQIATLDPAYCEPYQATPGDYVKISVTDTGAGMDAATRQRIFDPFFTTKAKSRGTGLGLASAYGIIKNHNGIILVYSEVGHGSTFNIYLPLSEEEAIREAPMEENLVRGTETVLLVDDEEMILEVGQEMLEELGYCVLATPSGEKAIEMVKQKGNGIDMVILDLIMPGMDGGKVFEGIREIRPQMPVLLSSGYAINGQANEIMQWGCNGFLQKPFNIPALSKKIRQILDGVKNQD